MSPPRPCALSPKDSGSTARCPAPKCCCLEAAPVASIMADLLRALGVPADDILVEGQSQTTYENLVFVQPMLGPQPFVLVAAACDLPRAMAVAQKLGMHPVAAPACIWTLQHHAASLSVREVFDGMLTPSLERLARLQ